MYTYWLSPQAEASIEEIYYRGYVEFGQRIADEYDQLIRQAINDICEDPERPGSRSVPGKEDGLRQYFIVHSKKRAHVNIKKPRHDVLYYFLEDRNTVIIADVLRGGREKAREAIKRGKIMKWLPPDS